ncbi:MAG TPA: hypothetical protein VHC69_01790 [Polyangiaceae bacterium]|nr:hypothetical protein [Polyangiaceae bacterium]
MIGAAAAACFACGGVARNDASPKDVGDGARSGTAAAKGSSTSSGGGQGGTSGDAGPGASSGASAGNVGSSVPGAGNAGNVGSSGQGGGGAGAPWLPEGGLPDPPRTWKTLNELSTLHMESPLSSIVHEQCATSFTLSLDRGRDGSVDATEQRYFDQSGRLVAAELVGADGDGGIAPRKRVHITYDDQGRPTQYLYGVEGSAALDPWINACPAPVAGLPRGTVVDLDYSSPGFLIVRSVTTEDCSTNTSPVCETLSFDDKGGFYERRRGCQEQEGVTMPDGSIPLVMGIADQLRGRDSTGRLLTDSVTVPPRTENVWDSPINYTYPATNQVVLDAQILCCNGLAQSLTRTFGDDGRITRETFETQDTVTYDYDPDGCGVTESTDLWNDGVTDIVTKTVCTAGRVTHQEERNMVATVDTLLPVQALAASDSDLVDRKVTPLNAEPQSQVTLDIDYGSDGRVRDRKFQVTTFEAAAYIPRSQHEVFRDDGDGRFSSDLDREMDPTLTKGNRVVLPPEAATSTCAVTHACSGASAPQDEGDRCEPGLAMNVMPAPYQRVPGVHTLRDLSSRKFPFSPYPASFIGSFPLLRDVIGF